MSGSLVTVCAGSGGVGVTQVAVNLAWVLRDRENARVLLVDGSQPIPGNAARLAGVARARPLADLLPLLDHPSPQRLAEAVSVAPGGPALLPLVGDVLQSRLITHDVIGRTLDRLALVFDRIVVDLGTTTSMAVEPVLERTAAACVVAAPEAPDRARACLDLLSTSLVPQASTIVCLGHSRTDLRPAQLVAGWDDLDIVVALRDAREAMHAAALTGLPIVRSQPRHAYVRQIDRLSRSVLDRLVDCDAAGPQPATPDAEVARLKPALHRRLLEEITLRKADVAYLSDPVKMAEMRRRTVERIHILVDEALPAVHDRKTRSRLAKELLDEALGLGPLDDLIADADVTEIMVNGPSRIYVERGGVIERTSRRFTDAEQLRGIIERIVGPLGRRVDEHTPMVDARLPDGSRVNAILPPLALTGPTVTIRKFSRRVLTSDDLVSGGSLNQAMALFLRAAVRSRLNIVISGGTGSGKTTLLNILAAFVNPCERIVTIEDAAELRLSQEHVVSLESRPPNIEGTGAITIRDLVRNSLRMRPDRIVVGECRGGEAIDMLQAMNTGHDGSLTTVHASSPLEALARLETMTLLSGIDLPSRAIREQVARAIHLVVQQARFSDGSRRIKQIAEIGPLENGGFVAREVFVFRQSGVDHGKVHGTFAPTGYVPAFVATLPRLGLELSPETFIRQEEAS